MDHSDHMMHTETPVTEPAAGHGMAVVGVDAIFLSHLPMFHAPHDYQVILETSFGAADRTYRDDRAENSTTRLYTFAPDRFVLSKLFRGANDEPPALTSFAGSLVRNHFEQPPAHPEEAVEIATDVAVDVVNVVYHQKFDPHGPMPDHLEYLLFGRGNELFLAHLITGPPDFDQLISARIQDLDFTDDHLGHGVAITLTDRPNTPDGRIREGEQVSANARVDDHDVPVEIDADTELYMETSDLT